MRSIFTMFSTGPRRETRSGTPAATFPPWRSSSRPTPRSLVAAGTGRGLSAAEPARRGRAHPGGLAALGPGCADQAGLDRDGPGRFRRRRVTPGRGDERTIPSWLGSAANWPSAAATGPRPCGTSASRWPPTRSTAWRFPAWEPPCAWSASADAAQPYLEAAARPRRALAIGRPSRNRRGERDPKLPHQLGMACAAAGRYQEARAWLMLAIQRDPLDAEGQQTLLRAGTWRSGASAAIKGAPTGGT